MRVHASKPMRGSIALQISELAGVRLGGYRYAAGDLHLTVSVHGYGVCAGAWSCHLCYGRLALRLNVSTSTFPVV